MLLHSRFTMVACVNATLRVHSARTTGLASISQPSLARSLAAISEGGGGETMGPGSRHDWKSQDYDLVLENVAEQYRKEGYTVVYTPTATRRPIASRTKGLIWLLRKEANASPSRRRHASSCTRSNPLGTRYAHSPAGDTR